MTSDVIVLTCGSARHAAARSASWWRNASGGAIVAFGYEQRAITLRVRAVAPVSGRALPAGPCLREGAARRIVLEHAPGGTDRLQELGEVVPERGRVRPLKLLVDAGHRVA
jgi:hypothetical protein